MNRHCSTLEFECCCSSGNSKAANVPKDNIQKALKASEKPRGDYTLFDVRGPEKTGILVEGETDNVNRLRIDINTALKKSEASIVGQGAVANVFERKGVITLPVACIEEDELFELATDAGAENIEQLPNPDTEDDDDQSMVYEVTTSFEDYAAVSKAIETSAAGKYVMAEYSGLLMIPLEHSMVSVSEEVYDECMEIISKLEELPEVTNVFHNMQLEGEEQ